jgi:UDP-glucose:(heptosyl)LPS alpha-1,3-glucosyltransferase
MRLALAISSLFPSGGLQRECVALARGLADAGHDVTIVTADYRAAMDTGGVAVEDWRIGGVSNPLRDFRLGKRLGAARARFDGIVGFNKMPNIDIYFSGDPAYRDLVRSRWRWLSPKFHAQLALERQVFGPNGPRIIIALSPRQVDSYRRSWGTPEDRFRLLPPTLDPGRRHPEYRSAARQAARQELQVGESGLLWLAIANVPRIKGVDRTLRALRAFPDATLAVAGVDAAARSGALLRRQADRLGVGRRVRLLGFRGDVARLMAAADLLLHPARLDTTGLVILEAIANGLPAIVTSVCGFAPHVEAADAGIVLAEPFSDEILSQALRRAQDPATRATWSRNGAAYGRDPWLSSGHAEAVALIRASFSPAAGDKPVAIASLRGAGLPR